MKTPNIYVLAYVNELGQPTGDLHRAYGEANPWTTIDLEYARIREGDVNDYFGYRGYSSRVEVRELREVTDPVIEAFEHIEF